jgi:hypothetical protein
MARKKKKNKQKKKVKRLAMQVANMKLRPSIRRNFRPTALTQLWRAIMQPFENAPPRLGDNFGNATVVAQLYDRRVIKLDTDLAAYYISYPTIASTTAEMASINYSLPVLANDGNAWSTANSTYAVYGGSATCRTLSAEGHPICGAVRCFSTGTLTGTSGLLFAGIAPVNGTSPFSATSPNNTITQLRNYVQLPIDTRTMVRWMPADVTTFSLTNSTSWSGAGTVPYSLYNGCAVGILGGQIAQTLFVESVYYVLLQPLYAQSSILPQSDECVPVAEAMELFKRAQTIDKWDVATDTMTSHLPNLALAPTSHRFSAQPVDAGQSFLSMAGNALSGLLSSPAVTAASAAAGTTAVNYLNRRYANPRLMRGPYIEEV